MILAEVGAGKVVKKQPVNQCARAGGTDPPRCSSVPQEGYINPRGWPAPQWSGRRAVVLLCQVLQRAPASVGCTSTFGSRPTVCIREYCCIASLVIHHLVCVARDVWRRRPDTQPRRGATRRWSAADMRLLAPAVVVALVALAAAGQFSPSWCRSVPRIE